jgi:hypothetical protein
MYRHVGQMKMILCLLITKVYKKMNLKMLQKVPQTNTNLLSPFMTFMTEEAGVAQAFHLLARA